MKKLSGEKTDNRAWGFANADKVQQERLFENSELVSEVEKIQVQYDLPLSSYWNSQEYIQWMGYDEPIELNSENNLEFLIF